MNVNALKRHPPTQNSKLQNLKNVGTWVSYSFTYKNFNNLKWPNFLAISNCIINLRKNHQGTTIIFKIKIYYRQEYNLRLIFFSWCEILPKWKNIKIKGNILPQYFHFWGKKSPYIYKFQKISSYLDSDMHLVPFFKLVFKLFKQVIKTYHHLMLNPSWDVSLNQWFNIRNLKKISFFRTIMISIKIKTFNAILSFSMTSKSCLSETNKHKGFYRNNSIFIEKMYQLAKCGGEILFMWHFDIVMFLQIIAKIPH